MFTHLHVHSHFSFLDGVTGVDELIAHACRQRMAALALTDVNGFYGVIPFWKRAKEMGIKPIIGAEVDEPEVGGQGSGGEGQGSGVRGQGSGGEGGRGVSLGTRNAELGTRNSTEGTRNAERGTLTAGERAARVGYRTGEGAAPRNIPSAPSISHGSHKSHRSYDPSGGDGADGGAALASSSTIRPLNRARRAILLARDLAGYAAISALLTRRQIEPDAFDLRAELDRLLEAHGDNVYALTDAPALIESLGARKGLYGELILTPKRRAANRRLYEAARERDVPLVVTNDVHFAAPEDYEAHRIARAIAALRTTDTLDPEWLAEPDNHLKSASEMLALVRGLKSATRATEEIADGCNLEFTLRDWQFPRVELPPTETAYSVLARQAFEGLQRRYHPLTPAVMARLEYELKIIEQMGFCEYFLAVREIVAEAERRGSPVLGRGSAANSIVSYALGFTPADPLRLNLYFERFLNPARTVPPDIDLDFSWRERDGIVEWIFEHFGWDRVALISTTICLRARQAIREVGKALGLPESEVNAFTRPIPGWLSHDRPIAEAIREYPECRDLPVHESPWREVIPAADRLMGAPRNLSIHCGGVVITPRPITDYTPLQRSGGKGTIITQMDMHPIEDLGLVKIDILSNRSLGVYKDVLAAIRCAAA
ncbi:MAG: PHP domain-containing protein [Candidatus Sumerlaeota bacterium]|nr:PHP domain-containing protein [Candidatus Sumerlaeota bacterium]